jgi:hypothetical protein
MEAMRGSGFCLRKLLEELLISAIAPEKTDLN